MCGSECDQGTSQRRPTECVGLSVIKEPHRGGLVPLWLRAEISRRSNKRNSQKVC